MANKKRDYYEVLGISKQATQDEIKRAFRRLAMQYHPDRNKAPDAEEKFKEINEAYEVLSDEKKKQTYDQFGHDGLNQQGFSGGSNPFDIFEQFFGGSNGGGVKFSFGGDGGGFGDIFGDMFGGGSNRRRQQRSSSNDQIYDLDIHASITISFLDSVLGGQRNIKVSTKKECPHCHGTGADSPSDVKTCPKCNGSGVVTTRHRTILGIMESQEYCPDCHGTGKIVSKVCSECKGKKYIDVNDVITIDIEAGIENGTTLKFTKKGNTWKNRVGDLYIVVYVQPSKLFQRKGDMLYANVLVDPIDAITGSRIKIPTPYGIKEVDLKSNTANGEQITVSGFGIKNNKHRMFGKTLNGDLVITVVYAKPKKYSRDEIEKLKQINNDKNYEVSSYEETIAKELK